MWGFLLGFLIPEWFVHQEMCLGDNEGNYCGFYHLKAQDNLTQKEASCLTGVKCFCKCQKQLREVQLFRFLYLNQSSERH